MDKRFDGTETIGAVVADFPGAAEVFKHYKIDFCCGGDRQLVTVMREQELDGAAVLAELNQAYITWKSMAKVETDWNTADLNNLIEHIVKTHHAYLKQELPAIGELTTKILRVHGAKHRELSQVHRLFHLLKMELEQHLIKEEEELFPQIIQYAANPSTELLASVVTVIDTIESEHTNAGDILKELDALTGHYAAPADGCTSYRLTYQKLQELESDLFQHIHLENNILHPRLKRLLK